MSVDHVSRPRQSTMSVSTSIHGEATLDGLFGLTRAGLDAADQLVVLAFGDIDVVVGHVAPALLDLALELIPASVPLPRHRTVHDRSFGRRLRVPTTRRRW